MRRRAAAAALLLLLLTACSKYGGATTTQTPSPLLSGIDVTTVSGPTCPVQREGESCTAPISATVVVTQGGDRVATLRTASDGRGRIPLVPGTYTVSGEGPTRPLPRPPAPQQVTVPGGRFVAVQVLFDTGIR